MPSNTSPVQKEYMTKKSITDIPKEKRLDSRPSQSTEEWLKELGDLEAQSKGSSEAAYLATVQVSHKQLSTRLQENIDHEDILDLLERGEF